ncbi:MAG: sialidase family protein [Pseudoxanthomonas sp.]
MRPFPLLFILMLAACSQPASTPPATASAPATAAAIAAYAVSDWAIPVVATAAQPDLVLAPAVTGVDGRLLLSWIEAGKTGGHALKFATFNDNAWSAPRVIARGQDWFVNWADTPHVLATADGALWAQWLRQSASAKYAYDVVLSRSGDGGTTWSQPVTVNGDGTPTEHGFVSLWPQSRDTLGIAWLDGRSMAAGEPAGHDGHGGGAMTLRVAHVDAMLEKSAETELDPRTCDCCQTDAAITARGPLLVYRDRDGDEIRDIVSTRFDNGAWTMPRKVHDDRWKMPACPVNGPALAARDNDAWVAWYTAAGDVPKVRLAHSTDAGDSFSAPLELDSGTPVQGRVGVAAAAGEAWVNWTREDAAGQSLWLARYRADLGTPPQRVRIASLQGRGRATGFPQMVVLKGIGYVVWTDVVEGKPVLRGARVAVAAGAPRQQAPPAPLQ